MLNLLLFCIVCAVANRARGTKLFELTESTIVGRAVSMSCIAIISAFLAGDFFLYPIILCGLMIFCTPAWDNYWSAAINNPTDINKKAFIPVDFIMKFLPEMPLRLWGAIAMGLRAFICGYPLYAALGYYGYTSAYYLGFSLLLYGAPYVLSGLNPNKGYVIAEAEYVTGFAIIGPTIYTAISQTL